MILTSQPATFLPEMRKSTGYEGEAIVDESNELVWYLREKFGWEVAITERKGYEHGMAQPGVLVLKKDGEVLEKWAIVPSLVSLLFHFLLLWFKFAVLVLGEVVYGGCLLISGFCR